jgi:catechol 2,3-dioxygenase-like lactoylglutathione lyase family enzyme
MSLAITGRQAAGTHPAVAFLMFKDANTFFSFSTDDLKKAHDFYANTLGLDVKETPEGLSLTLAGGGKAFLYPKPNHQPATFTVLNFAVEDLEAAVAELQKRGVRFESYDLPDLKTGEDHIAHGGPGRGPDIAWFTDPAGNILSVLKPRP